MKTIDAIETSLAESPAIASYYKFVHRNGDLRIRIIPVDSYPMEIGPSRINTDNSQLWWKTVASVIRYLERQL